MKFTVEIEDFYLEEGELAAELKSQIKNEVVAKIRESIKDQVLSFMDDHIKSVINAELQTRIQLLMDDHLASGKVKDQYNKREEITVKEWITKYFTNNHPEIIKNIEAQVKKQVSELQNRYDLQFAAQLITKIKDQGFLKEDVAKMLLSGSEGN